MSGSERHSDDGLANDNDYLTDNSSEDGSTEDHQPEEHLLATLAKEFDEGKWDFHGTHKDPSKNELQELKTRFENAHHHTLRSRDHLNSNIFHVLARSRIDRISKLKPLVSWVIQRFGNLLTLPDKQDTTGFHLAIRHCNHKLVRYVLDGYGKAGETKGFDIDQIFRATQGGNNSLHLAMTWMTPVPQKETKWLKTIEMLIEYASPETLKMQNEAGLTPLHLAVEGTKATPQQLTIVKKLIERCEAALDVRGKKDLSPYQYHQETYEALSKTTSKQLENSQSGHGASKARTANLKNRTADDERVEMGVEPVTINAGNPLTQLRVKPRDGEDDGKSGFEPTRDTAPRSHEDIGERDHFRDQKPNPEAGQGSNTKRLRRQPTAGKDTEGSDSVVSREQHTKQLTSAATTSSRAASKHGGYSKKKVEIPSSKVTSTSAGEIAMYLKQTYLRKRNRRQALKFLYGGVSDTQVDFNLFGKEGEITEDDFITGYKCAKLEDTLQLVRIPNLVIKPSAAQSLNELDDDSREQSEHSRSREAVMGRTDLGIIFRWLQRNAMVKKIIKLNVDDSRDPPHCDEEIEKAVKPFDVEVWNWVKIDICCETIAETAPNARHINLYWSGKNAVLRGWSDPEGGLARLPNLEKVTVILRSGIEGWERNQKNFESFRKRLAGYAKRKDIHIALDDMENQIPSIYTPRVKKENAFQNHHWLKCMDSFSNFIVNVRFDNQLSNSLKPIKIAIIDDGIDTTERKLHGRVIGGQYFCDQNESPSFCVSAGGHGTMMAQQVIRVFPQAKIISLKLDEHAQSDGSSHFSVQSAAEAVRYAQKLGANIINMSWSIESTSANKDSLGDLQHAINQAEQERILMFCSASDQGKTEDKSFPGQWSRGQLGTLCRIGAATATGGEYRYVSWKDVDFLFPGRVVETEQDEDSADNAASMRVTDRSTEGSSLATAFASGLAGLILYILQIVSRYFDGDDDKVAAQYESVLSDMSKMKKIFRRLATDKKFVEVWKVFESVEDGRRTGGRDSHKKFCILRDICVELLTGLD